LASYGVHKTQGTIAKEMKTPRTMHEGTKPAAIIAALRKQEFAVRAGIKKTIRDIQAALKKDSIVVICYTEPIMEWGHYAIVRRFKGNEIVLLDPDSRTGRTTLLTSEFKRRWHDPLFTHTVRWAAFVDGLKIKAKKPAKKKRR